MNALSHLQVKSTDKEKQFLIKVVVQCRLHTHMENTHFQKCPRRSSMLHLKLSIQFLYLLNPNQGCGGAGACPRCHWARGRAHPGQVTSPLQGHTETNETKNYPCPHSLLGSILQSAINLTCMFLGGGRKPEFPENPRIHGEKRQTLHRKAPAGIQTWNPLVVRQRFHSKHVPKMFFFKKDNTGGNEVWKLSKELLRVQNDRQSRQIQQK